MKANRKFVEADDRAVSAVIGVILMVAITVAIAATVYVYVSGMIGGNIRSTPTISLVPNAAGGSVTFTTASVSTAGVEWADITFTLVDRTAASQFPQTIFGIPAVWNVPSVPYNINVTVTKPTALTVTGGQIITITPTTTGQDGLYKGNQYQMTLVYTPTGGTLSTATWTQ